MFRTQAIAAVLALAAGPAFAESHAMDLTPTGDAEAGEKAFRQCVSCHVVQDEDGEVLAGRNAKTGPNLYGIAGGAPGAVEDFRYSDLIMAANEQGVIYDEAAFVGYVMDPTAWLKETTGENGRGKMSFKVRKEDDAKNLYAYLYSLAPPEMDGDEEKSD